MFYKHWKKIALTLTALFWAGCDDSASSSEVVLYGCPDDICAPAPESSSDANGTQSSSSETTASSSSEAAKPESSSSVFEQIMPAYGVEVDFTCVPMDSSVAYFATDFSADNAKFWKEEAAKHDAVDKIDSIKQTLTETPMCLENLRRELDMFVALYGAPTVINNAVESCSDGSTRPSEEYARFLKMQEEWEANKSILDEELQKVYEDKMKEIEKRINKCLSGEADE